MRCYPFFFTGKVQVPKAVIFFTILIYTDDKDGLGVSLSDPLQFFGEGISYILLARATCDRGHTAKDFAWIRPFGAQEACDEMVLPCILAQYNKLGAPYVARHQSECPFSCEESVVPSNQPRSTKVDRGKPSPLAFRWRGRARANPELSSRSIQTIPSPLRWLIAVGW